MRDAKLQFRFGQNTGGTALVGFNQTSVGSTIAGLQGASSTNAISVPLLLGGYTNTIADTTAYVGNATSDQPAPNGQLLWGHNNRNQMYVHSAVQFYVPASATGTATMVVEGSSDNSNWVQLNAAETTLTATTGTASTITLTTSTAAGLLTSAAPHGLQVGDQLLVAALGVTVLQVAPPGGATAGVALGQVYVVTSVPSTSTFTIGLGPAASLNGVYTAASLISTAAGAVSVFRKMSAGAMLQASIPPSSRTYYRVRYVTTFATTACELMILNAYIKNGRDGASF
jgi:hypothetical protein